MTYKTPGVFVEEISLLPPSVAQVETAIPAFIGYTEKAVDEDGNNINSFPHLKRISSLVEYEQFFGKTNSEAINVTVTDGEPVSAVVTPSNYLMYYAMQMFYGNGGGPCYIVSVGLQNSGALITYGDLLDGLNSLKKKDEPTLILFPSAVNLAADSDYYEIQKQALLQCQDLGDRFVIMDIYDGADATDSTDHTAFRTGVGNNNLKYGAAYTPYLKSTLNYYYHRGSVSFTAAGTVLDAMNWAEVYALLLIEGLIAEATAQDAIASGASDAAIAATAAERGAQAAISAANLAVEVFALTSNVIVDDTLAQTALDDANAALAAADPGDLGNSQTAAADALAAATDARTATLSPNITGGVAAADLVALLAIFSNDFDSKVKQLLGLQFITMPPSGAVAGVYARVDRTRGVWKAPANVSLNLVSAPSAKITNADQDGLNVDATGKSINAIRTFTGKGVLVWGARTLAGNDNEWRYIGVRRFFNMAEESIKKASEQFVFEPNDANTWVKVRAMIENFLVLQWRAGALAGATPEEAFFVKVGLGQTMTALDILEGRMNVEIGMAVVRPAEFIILKFSHKMQES